MRKNNASATHDSIIDTYLEAFRFISESTDDYLFLYEIGRDRLYFPGGTIKEKYNILHDGKEYCSSKEWLSIVSREDIDSVEYAFNNAEWKGKTSYNQNYRIRNREGRYVWINIRGHSRTDSDGSPFIMLGRVSDTIFKHKIDPLTGLFNKTKYFDDKADDYGNGQKGFILLVGVDNLRKINIQHGWERGNKVLKIIAETLSELSSHRYHIYRMEEDRFAVRMNNASQQDVTDFFDELIKLLSLSCTVSGGAAKFENIPGVEGSAYQSASEALANAKNAGPSVLLFATKEDYEKKLYDKILLEELKNEVRTGFKGFYLCYQPQIKSGIYDLFGAEALLRYNSSTRGSVMPDTFIPLLEDSGIIYEVGLWVLHTALEQCAAWRRIKPNFHISVNISYVQLKHHEITKDVLHILKKSGLPGSALTLEITESMQLQDFSNFNKIISEWKNEGIEISVDDFGTGYSSLAYLKNLTIDEIKIDRSFVTGINCNSYNYLLLKNMVELADSTNIRVCCEGVEEEGELQALEELKPFLFQGFIFSRPLPAEKFNEIFFNKKNKEFQKIKKHVKKIQKTDVGNLLNFKPLEVLKATDIGLWVIRIDKKKEHFEMYADETTRRIMGANKSLTPEELYNHWHTRINAGYFSYVNNSVQKILEGKKLVQLQYTWIHPDLGDVSVRCTGTRTDDSEGKYCLVGYHIIIDELDRPQALKEDEEETFDFDEKRSKIYFHTKRKLIFGEESHENNFPESWIENKIVHPHFAGEFKNLFCNVSKKTDNEDSEIMLKTNSGDYSWFRIRTTHLSYDEKNKNVIIVRLVPADKERLAKLENMRIKNFYRASLSEYIAYAELDLESGRIKELGGLWKEHEEDFKGEAENLLKYIAAGRSEYIDDGKELLSERLKSFIESRNSTQTFVYNCSINGKCRKVKLVVHSFKDDFSKNIYALLCLKTLD